MAVFTNTKEIEVLREGGRRLATILEDIEKAAQPGVSTDELDRRAEALIRKAGDEPSLLGYHPSFAKRPYPSVMCVSVNDEVVHGIPSENPVILKEGDIVGFDLVVTHGGLIVDSAITVPVGGVDEKARKLIYATKQALAEGISAARGGAHTGDIGHAIETSAHASRFSVVEALCGHGVGRSVHEEPQVPNVGVKGEGVELVPGMLLALEPMLNEGGSAVVLQSDGYTFRTKDHSRSAHFEHTILITDGEPEVLTRRSVEKA